MQKNTSSEKLEFVYKLGYEESYETFFLLSIKGGKRLRKVMTAIMTIIAAVMLVLYYLDSQKVHYFMLVILDICMLYYLIYVPVLKAQKGAKAVERQNGIYRLELTEDGQIRFNGQMIELQGDKDARAIESEKIFVIRPDRMHTFCLPKRIINMERMEEIRKILKSNVKYIQM